MSTVQTCLSQKPQRIISVASSDSVHQALDLMKTNRVRAILVIDQGKLAGIVSQGDCAIRTLLPGLDAKATPVSQIMTPNPTSVKPGDPMELCMGIMVSRGIRHLPVVSHDQVMGVVSIGDVVKEMMSDLSEHVSFLETYIKGHH